MYSGVHNISKIMKKRYSFTNIVLGLFLAAGGQSHGTELKRVTAIRKAAVKKILLATLIAAVSMNMLADGPGGDPPGGDTPGGGGTSTDSPDGAYYTLADGSTVTKSNETLSTSTSDYNVVQVTSGTLTLNSCTLTKTGDTSRTDGDATSFYGTNSSVYAGGSSAVIYLNDCSITSTAKGSNAVFSYNGATIYVDGITIYNNSSVSRGLHCTYGGTIIATDVDITTCSETSSTIATDRGGGTVTVTGGTATAKGNNSAVLYSTGTITANNLTGVSEQGEIAVVEGDNGVIISGCAMTSGSAKRGLMMLQSGSGDAQGSNAYITVSDSTLTVTGSSVPLCEVPTENNGTLTLTDVTLNVASGILMYVDYNTQWSTYGGYGNLVLETTQDSWTYTGTVDADSYSNATVSVGENVIWNGAVDTDNNAKTVVVTVESGAVWNLTADTYVSTLVNNGTINKNGYTLTAGSTSGNGTINETSSGTTTLTVTLADATVGYGQTATLPAAQISGLASGDDVSYVVTSDYKAGSPVGEYTITATAAGTDLAKYDAPATVTSTLTVTKAALTITADDMTVACGDAIPSYTVTYSGFVNSEDSSVLSGTLNFACDYTTTSDAGTYTITPSGLSSDNYTISYVSGTLTVTEAEEETPEISYSFDSETGILTLQFTGDLYESEDGETWTLVEGAQDTYTVDTTQGGMKLYRSVK